jgi:uroporphyrinogen-III synthase
MHLIVTRPQPDAEELQRKLEVRGHRVTVAPLLDIHMGPQRPIANRPYQALLVTSANAARALMDHPARGRLLSKVVYAVGPQSRSAVSATGFSCVVEGGGDVAAVIEKVQQDIDPTGGPLLYLSGEETSGDVETMLAKSGYEVDRVIMYAALPATHLPAALIGIIKRRAADGVLLYSRRTARVWRKCIAAADLELYMDALTHFCLSAAVATAIPSSWRVKTAASASEQGMFDLIENVGGANVEGPVHGR